MADAFSVTVGSELGTTVVSIRGNVDWATSAMVGTILDAVVDQGHVEIVADFEEVRFIDSTGISVIAGVAARVAQESGVLSIRAIPLHLWQTLEQMDVPGTVLQPRTASLGAEQQRGERSAVALGAPPTRTGSAANGALAGDASMWAALRRTTELAAHALPGADGVSVILHRHGRMETVASSDDTIVRMDQHQFASGEGPCLSAAAEGRWFHVESLTDEQRWPVFVPRAAREGIASILSTPLRTPHRTIGAFNVYSGTERAFDGHAQELAALFAVHASELVIAAGDHADDATTAERIAQALHSRAVISQAQGILMERRRTSASVAAGLLHRAARSAHLTVAEWAERVIGSTRDRDDGQAP